MASVIPIHTETYEQNKATPLRISCEEEHSNSKDEAKPKCNCHFGSPSCQELEYAYYQIRRKFPEWPDADKYQFSIPNSIFLKGGSEDYFYHHSFSHNRLSSKEFTRIFDYFNQENYPIRRKYFLWQKLRVRLFFTFIGLTTIFFVSFFSTGIASDRAMTLYFSFFASLVYGFFLITVHLSSIKAVLLYNLKAFLLQVSLEQLQPRSISLRCDDKKISIIRSQAEYDEVNENLLDLSENCIKILPEPDIFRYYFSSNLTSACQKEKFNPEIVDGKFSLESFEELKRAVCKEHPFATKYFKKTAFPRWLTLILYPCWLIIYMVCVFATSGSSTVANQRSFGLLAPIYTVIVPHVFAGFVFFLFRYLPNAFLKPRINNTCLKLSVKIFQGKRAAFRVNTQNNSVYLFSLDAKLAPLPVKRKLPYFLDPLDAKDNYAKGIDTARVSTDDGKNDEPPLESNDKKPIQKRPKIKKLELHQLGDRKLPKVTVTLDDLDSHGLGQRALKKFFCAHSQMHFDDADHHRRHCIAHTQTFTIQSGKHAVECHYIDQLPSLKKHKDFIKAKREEMSRSTNSSFILNPPSSSRGELIANSGVVNNEGGAPESTRILDTSLHAQVNHPKELNYFASLEEILEEDGSAKLKQGTDYSLRSRDLTGIEKKLQDDVSGFTMQEIGVYIEHL